MNENNQNTDEQELEQPEVEKGISPVANMPAKNLVVIGVFVLVIAVMIYMLFFSGSSDNNKKDQPKLEQRSLAIKPTEADLPLPSAPQSAPEPRIDAPAITAPIVTVAPPSPPKIIAPPALPEPTPVQPSSFSLPRSMSSENNEAMNQRKKSTIMVLGTDSSAGTAAGKTSDQDRINSLVINPYYEPARTSAEQVKATRIGDLTATVAQGKILDAVLETAINTDFPGYVRAIVSRDVYAEAGKSVLIPKGSRLVGAYSAELKRTQKRVMIIWNRVIRPDGVDMMLDSPGVDQIGRAGSEGFVDTKFFEIFTNALLMSVVNFTITYQAEAFKNKTVGKNKNLPTASGRSTANPQQLADQITTWKAQGYSDVAIASMATAFASIANQTNTSTINPQTGAITNTSTDNKNNIDKAFEDATKTMNDAMKNIATGLLDERPTITLDQGTRIKVFVKKDLIFPASYSGQARILK